MWHRYNHKIQCITKDVREQRRLALLTHALMIQEDGLKEVAESGLTLHTILRRHRPAVVILSRHYQVDQNLPEETQGALVCQKFAQYLVGDSL